MARYSSAFTTKFEVALDSRIGRALANMENMSACAGILNDPENAFKARVNHYGGHITKRKEWRVVGHFKDGRDKLKLVDVDVDIKIPERHFIDVPLEKDSWMLKQFEQKVAYILSGGRMRNIAAESTSIGQRGGVSRNLYEIAQRLAEAQKDAVYMAHPENKPSTEKKKGFNAPLRETYDMVDSIKGWVEGYAS